MNARKTSASGRERYFLGFALLVPVAVVALLVTQVPSTGLASTSSMVHDASPRLLTNRPASSNPPPPPTLAPLPPTSTPAPTPVVSVTPTPHSVGTYTVASGDELKTIAAEHNIPVASLIAANTILNPDSLKIGQVLVIPAR